MACAGGCVVLEKLSDQMLDQVAEKAEYMADKLETMPHVKSVSGLGLMIGVELDGSKRAKDVVQSCIDHGLIALTAKSKVRSCRR